ncbi:hypothetical protein ASH00_04540 [Arthrobacter sp. Soil782]|nr:hypothetical protein ASH00_04540 [Arthrobacter sp. Soil782]
MNGPYRTAFNYAVSNYNAATQVTLTAVDVSGPTFTARNQNYGVTGWEAQATTNCPFGTTTSSALRMNQYYLQGDEPLNRLKVVWAHEIGHGLGLAHVSTVARVMHTYPSTSYSVGVSGLTTDDVNGINARY